MLGFLVTLVYLLFWIPTIRTGYQAVKGAKVRWWRGIFWGFIGTVLFFVLDYLSGFYVQKYLWFAELGQPNVLATTYKAYFAIVAVGTAFALAVLYASLSLIMGLAAPMLPENGKIKRYAPHEFEKVSDLVSPLEQVRLSLIRIAIPAFSVIFGFIVGSWCLDEILLFFSGSSVGVYDPVFGMDLSFWLFGLPFWNALFNIVQVLAVFAFIVGGGFWGLTIYCLSLIEDTRETINRAIKSFASLVLAAVALDGAVLYWLSRYNLLYSNEAAAYGAGYTDIHVRLPMYGAFAVILLIAVPVFVLCGVSRGRYSSRVTLGAGAFIALFWLVAVGMIYPYGVQRLQVRPNELASEREFIERTITWTRTAYGISEQIEEKEFKGVGLSEAHVKQYPNAIQNVRLWDWRIAQPIYGQQQSLRRYYSFTDVDVDRYMTDDSLRQVMLAARELIPENVPEKTWVNKRLKYTHGYGAIAHYGNTKTAEGFPRFAVGDMPPYGPAGMQITRPQIYFGEATTNPVIVNTKEKEFDFPSGDKNAETVYSGTGGIKIGSGTQRFLVAWQFDGWAALTSPLLSPESKIVFDRDLKTRISKIAPFLTLDKDPYLVIRKDGTLVWIADAYTTSSWYPYSEPHEFQGRSVNYIRNSVKVVVDAYNGTTEFYIADAKDPIINTWSKVFPSLFHRLEDMPQDLRDHLRYGEDYFRVQAEVLLNYHVTDAGVFYNKEDVWSVAQEQYEDNRQNVEPYYVLARLPGSKQEEMMLTLPFTPYSNKDVRKENLVGWIAARVDGEHYGKLLLHRFPKGLMRYGPMQVESQIDQDREMSAQITLWNQSGSKVVRGHLLVLPIGDAILYAEPLYIKSTTSPMPQLQKVILATQQGGINGHDAKLNLVWGDTFEEALRRLIAGAIPEKINAVDAVKKLTAEEVIKTIRDRFARYRMFNAEGNFEKAGSELRAIKELLE